MVVVLVVVVVVVVISTFSVVLRALALFPHLLEHLELHLDLLHGLTGRDVTISTGGLLTISGASVTTGWGGRTVFLEHFDRTAAPHRLVFSRRSPPTSGLSAAAGVGAGVGDGRLT